MIANPDRPSAVRIASGITVAATSTPMQIAAIHETSAVSSATISPPSSTTEPSRPSGPIPGRDGSRQFP